MRIDELRPDHLGSSAARPAQGARKSGAAAPPAPAEPVGKGDSVEISEQARSMASTAGGEAVKGALDPERLAELRRWLAAGGHNDPAVLRHVAGKLIDGGELTDNRPAQGSEA
jgi:hypothetical protein